ncbi:alkylated DNA repair protein alkB homolog 1 [Fopius arisanus]|uniref:Alkbh1_1 protein n=2 Tax=Fopius arisanus TaxID=64838 RepID=A0A0C9PGL5_9HYME|nr:PREDICTED: alkylated DNA repair protein alkB homolog 1 [Fopius arisanus]
MFKDIFKYYKSKKPPPNYEHVIDVSNGVSEQVRKVPVQGMIEPDSDESKLGLKPVDSWEIFELPKIPGLIFIRNPFTPAGQRYWITRCFKDYSRRPNKLNIDIHGLLEEEETWWDVCTRDDSRADHLIPKLRWATLGYHHNWETKHYSENDKTKMPMDLNEMARVITKILGFDGYRAEAAIINFYRMNSTLAGHVDHSEDNLDAPLVSVSFGQSAIFLIGGLKCEDPAHAIFVHSGDVIVMSGESRLRYHGVPRILRAPEIPWDDEQVKGDPIFVAQHDWSKARHFISEARINMNVRRVLKLGQEILSDNEVGANIIL